MSLLILGAMTALFVLAAPVSDAVFAPGFEGQLYDLTVALSRLLFPIVLLLGLSGLVVGVLNSFERFAVPALAPLFWNLAIIAMLFVLAPAFPRATRSTPTRSASWSGPRSSSRSCAGLRHTGVSPPARVRLAQPVVRRVLKLMFPVTIGLGLINFNLLVDSIFATLISDQAPAAIDKAFRIYMLPQGVFAVALATVIFPTLSRFAARGALEDLRSTMANGMRQILLLLVPAAAAILVL